MNNATFTLDCEQCLIFLLSYGDQEHVRGAEPWQTLPASKGTMKKGREGRENR